MRLVVVGILFLIVCVLCLLVLLAGVLCLLDRWGRTQTFRAALVVVGAEVHVDVSCRGHPSARAYREKASVGG